MSRSPIPARAALALLGLVATALPARALEVAPGAQAVPTHRLSLTPVGGGAPVVLVEADRLSVEMVNDTRALVVREADGVSGWVEIRDLRVLAVVAPTPAAQPAALPGRGPRPAAGVSELRPLRVAVYDFQLDGVDPTTGAVVSDSLLAEVRKLQGLSAIGMSDIRDMLSHEATKQLTGCSDDDSCLAEIGGALGVDELVTGKLVRVQGTHVIVLRRIDQGRAEVLGSFDQRLTAEGGEEFLAAIGPAVSRLYPGRPLRQGARRGVADELALRLHPPPLPRWSFWTAAGLTGLAAVTTGAAAVTWFTARSDYAAYAALSGSQLVDGATLVRKGQSVNEVGGLTLALLGGTGLLATATGAMALFVDWWGYGDRGREDGSP